MSNKEISCRLEEIERIFPFDSILDRSAEDTHAIARYYRRNRLAYSLFNSRKGFVHMGISRDGVFKKSDFYEQGKIIKNYLDSIDAEYILELAPGKAATTEYLAGLLPNAHFYGIDLPNGQMDISRYNNKSNLILSTGDYHNLRQYDTASMDAVYVIEALCHAHDRRLVISEAYRVLKPGGYFIIFDGYYSKSESTMTKEEKLAAHLLFKSMMVAEDNHFYIDFKKELTNEKLKIVYEEDLSKEIMPSLYRLEKSARKYIKRPRIAKGMRRILYDEFLGNAIAGYLFPIMVESGIFTYKLTVAQK